jgi:hypothetical protein
MPASWPTSVKTFTTRTDTTDVVYAAHINDLQDEVNAIETSLGVGVKGAFASVDARLDDIDTNKAAAVHTHDHGAALTGLADDDHPQYQLKSLLTTQGDIPYATGAGTWARLPKGTGLQYFRMNAGATAPEWAAFPTVPTTAVFTVTHTWAIGGEVKVPSGDTDYLVPMFVGAAASETVVLDKVRYVINSGTSVTFKMQLSGSDMTGFTGLSATTTSTTTDPADVAVADTNRIAPVVTAVSGTPKNLTITAYFKHTVTLS